MPKMTAPNTAVFAFQFVGWAYQPPDGDQTCLGYLKSWLDGGRDCDRLWMGNRNSRDLAARLYLELAYISSHLLKGIAYHLCLAVQLHGNWLVLRSLLLTVVELWRTGCPSADADSTDFYMITRGSFKILGSPGDWRHPSQHQRQTTLHTRRFERED